MCTVTWLPTDAGYHLFFNRDEQVSRPPATPPKIHEVGGVRCLYPVDSQAGGTWLGVNEHGLTIGVLNHYAAGAGGTGAASEPLTSRGLLVVSLLDARTAQEVAQRVSGSRLRSYAPFILIVLSPGGDLTTHTWDGSELRTRETVEPRFLTTSGFEPSAVASVRRKTYESWMRQDPTPSPDSLGALHASRLPEPGPYAVCMQRDDARTLSLSHIAVEPTQVRFSYADGPPSTTPLAAPVDLPRAS